VRAAIPLLAFATSLLPAPAFAARPFVTDDARIVDPGDCQIESFMRNQRQVDESEIWFVPGCTPGTKTEFSLGGFKLDNADSGTSSTVIAQAKTLLRPLAINGYGLAFTLGVSHQNPVDPTPRSQWAPFINIIGSLSLHDDAVVVHANIGSLQDRTADRTRHTWGIGSEIMLTGTRLSAIVEAYHQEGERPGRQVGLRYWIVPNRFQIDGTYGWQNANPVNRTWTSLGVRLLF